MTSQGRTRLKPSLRMMRPDCVRFAADGDAVTRDPSRTSAPVNPMAAPIMGSVVKDDAVVMNAAESRIVFAADIVALRSAEAPMRQRYDPGRAAAPARPGRHPVAEQTKSLTRRAYATVSWAACGAKLPLRTGRKFARPLDRRNEGSAFLLRRDEHHLIFRRALTGARA
jgi:hypothetical protein